MNELCTEMARAILNDTRTKLEALISHLSSFNFQDAISEIGKARNEIIAIKAEAKSSGLNPDFLNDLFVIEEYVLFFRSYSSFWENIVSGDFSASWNSLQNAIDCLRLIRRFSSIDISTFENQLIDLEALYPYKIFASTGIVVDGYDCSICGNDIDSFECHHLQGDLYNGDIAYAIARNILDIDHISMVLNPKDKRCVVQFDSGAPQFKVIRQLSQYLCQRVISIADFRGVEIKTIKIPNKDYVEQGRNVSCHCGSGKKFKKCCMNKKYIDFTHYEFVTK
jgi:hypothetical protein